jgi:hypothetical protein
MIHMLLNTQNDTVLYRLCDDDPSQECKLRCNVVLEALQSMRQRERGMHEERHDGRTDQISFYHVEPPARNHDKFCFYNRCVSVW